MDPLSALSVAAAVVQFVDYGTRLLSKTIEIYKSRGASSARVEELVTVSRDYEAYYEEVQSKSHLATCSSDAIFIRLCGECVDIGNELHESVNIVQTRDRSMMGRVFNSFVKALEQSLSEEKIKALRVRLDQVQSQMMTAALVFLWGEAKRTGQELTNTAQRQGALLELLGRSQQQGSYEGCTVSADPMELFSRDEAQATMWALLRLNWNCPEVATPSPQSTNAYVQQRDLQFCRQIVNSLFFDKIGYREGAIAEAHEQTFEWVFREPQLDGSGEQQWASFANWIESDLTEVYWITGKPGAGKSTLMKYITLDPRTKRGLEKWAAERPLIILDFYFWNSGSDLQKSREGFLRTVLFQLFTSRPDLVSRSAFSRWTMLKLFGQSVKLPGWDLQELEEVFRTAVHHVIQDTKLALFIDGLDEFEGDHRLLVTLVHDISRQPNVKVCVSSRPWNVFSDAFRHNPSLRVEQLTRRDIDRYVRDHFERSPGFHELRDLDVKGANTLINNVVGKAQGVFLWVTIVTAALVKGLGDGDNLGQLQRTLDELPENLTQLYDAIWMRVDPAYRVEGSKLFHIMEASRRSPWNLDTFLLWLSGDDCPATMATDAIKSTNKEAIRTTVRRRLGSRTMGLLEVPTVEREDVVDYMHRSARDWVMGWLKRDPDFDPYLNLTKGWILRLAAFDGKVKDDLILGRILRCLVYMEKPTAAANEPLLVASLDRLDAEMTRLADISYAGSGTYHVLGEKVRGCEQPPHWSSGVLLRDIRSKGSQSSYMTFMAYMAISDYVRAKVLANPSLLFSANPNTITPAEGCVMDILNPAPLPWDGIYFEACLDRDRLELLQFLLEQGADPGPLKARISRKKCRQEDTLLEADTWREDILQVIRETKPIRKSPMTVHKGAETLNGNAEASDDHSEVMDEHEEEDLARLPAKIRGKLSRIWYRLFS